MTQTPNSCYLCGGHSFELVATKLRYQKDQAGYRCKDCELIFLYPPMSPEEERRFYEEEYGIIYAKEKSTTPKDLFEARQGDARLYHEWVRDYLKPSNACLEVGCASGYFLMEIKSAVDSIQGIETHNELRGYCEGIGIPMAPSLQDCQPGSVDRLFAFFVLEHLGDPCGFLAAAKRACRKGGTICLVVPNVDDALISIYQIPAFRDFYFTPAHQFYYSRATLSALFRKAGFRRFEIAGKQRYDLSNHMHWMMAGRPGGMGRYNHIFDQAVLDAYKASLESRFFCDTLVAFVTAD